MNKIICNVILLFGVTGCSSLTSSYAATSSAATLQSASSATAQASVTPTPGIIPTIDLSVFRDEKLVCAQYSSENFGLYLLSPITSEPEYVIRELEWNAFYDEPSWSPDGERIVFSSDRGDPLNRNKKLYTIKSDGSDLRRLVMNTLTQHQSNWSPDGEHIVFNVDDDNYLYVVNADGTNLEQLIEAPSGFPVWSPDGERIAFISTDNIYIVNADGSDLHPVANQEASDQISGYSRISWSPDGRKIALRTRDGCGDIGVLDINSGAITRLTDTPERERDPAWSPDGKYIVYAQAAFEPCGGIESYGGPNYLLVMHADGSNSTQLTFKKGSFEPAWWPLVILQAGWKYEVTQAGSALNVRESPSRSASVVANLPKGAIFTTLEGPVNAEGYSWWRIRTKAGREGWMVDVPGWYMLEEAPEE